MRKDHIYYLKAILDQPNRLEDTDMILAQVTLQYEPVLESKVCFRASGILQIFCYPTHA